MAQSVTEINMMNSKIEDQSPLRNIKLRAGSFDRFKDEEPNLEVPHRLLTE